MPAPPKFVRGAGVDSVAEFAGFMTDQGEREAHLLAELTAMQMCDSLLNETIPAGDQAITSVRDLYCRADNGWFVFYTATSAQLPSMVTVLYVVQATQPFGALEAEAERRLRS